MIIIKFKLRLSFSIGLKILRTHNHQSCVIRKTTVRAFGARRITILCIPPPPQEKICIVLPALFIMHSSYTICSRRDVHELINKETVLGVEIYVLRRQNLYHLFRYRQLTTPFCVGIHQCTAFFEQLFPFSLNFT